MTCPFVASLAVLVRILLVTILTIALGLLHDCALRISLAVPPCLVFKSPRFILDLFFDLDRFRNCPSVQLCQSQDLFVSGPAISNRSPFSGFYSSLDDLSQDTFHCGSDVFELVFRTRFGEILCSSLAIFNFVVAFLASDACRELLDVGGSLMPNMNAAVTCVTKLIVDQRVKSGNVESHVCS